MTTVVSGLNGTHKNWWECDTGVAYLVSDGRPQGWRTNRMMKIFDLADPLRPRFIRDFGLPGQEPGSGGAPAPEGVHGPIAFRDRVYFAYGTSRNGVLQIVDRDRLLRGDPAASDRFAPTPVNLRYPEVGRGIAVLRAAASMAKWDGRPSPRKDQSGSIARGRGIAYVK